MIEVEKFIDNFKKGFDKEYLEHVFTDGNCYHFSLIVQSMYGGEIVYDPHETHFLIKINDRFYDIKGEIQEPMDYYYWDDFEEVDYNEYEFVKHNCVYKL